MIGYIYLHNCCEAPDYYDYSDDKFYKELEL